MRQAGAVDRGPTRRRRPNLSEQVAILTRQASCACGCGQSLEGRKIDYHHQHERALDGPDSAENWCAVVADDTAGRENNCHHRLTNGTKATTAGSSKHKVAKAARLEKARLALAHAEVATDTPEFLRMYPGAVNQSFRMGRESVEAFIGRQIKSDPIDFLIPKPQRRAKGKIKSRGFPQKRKVKR